MTGRTLAGYTHSSYELEVSVSGPPERRPKGTLLRFLGACLVVGACQGSDSEGSREALETWTVETEPVASIGGHDERDGYLLQRVSDATRLSDGRIVVADAGSSEIHVYDSLGTHVMTLGGEGEGPGEFTGVFQVQRLPGDTLLVLSMRPGLTWISPRGEYVRSRRLAIWDVVSVPCRIGEGTWRVLEDGSFFSVLEDNLGYDPCPPTPSSPWRQTALLGRSTTLDGSFDTLGIFPGTERNSPNYRVFGLSLALAFAEDRIYAGDTGAGEILALGFDGDTLGRYPVPWEAQPIPPEARTEDVRRWEDRDGTARVGNAYLYPDQYPAFGRLLADNVGHLWVMAYPSAADPLTAPSLQMAYAPYVEEGGARWRVLNEAGEVVAEVRTPPGLFPLEIGRSYILGLTRDELDVQSVQLYALVR